jgi:hypothetical protein
MTIALSTSSCEFSDILSIVQQVFIKHLLCSVHYILKIALK